MTDQEKKQRCSDRLEANRQREDKEVAPLTAPAPLTDDLAIVREAVEATFEQRPGYLTKIGAAVRAIDRMAAPAPQQSNLSNEPPHDITSVLREYAANPGYSHNDYADTMRQAADCIASLRAMIFNYDRAKAAPAAPVQTAELAEKMREMHDVQGQNGTWDCDPYMHGMYNGMEYMLAMVENREPNFRSAPAKWLHKPVDMSAAAKDVLDERRRQVKAEGWNAEHDDAYTDGQLSMAAACYATQGHLQFPENWPWSMEWWKPAAERRNLVKACALIIADIERLDRDALIAPSTGESKGEEA